MDPFSTTAFLISVTAGVLGNRSDDWLCKSYNTLFKHITTAKEPANRDIQRAVRRAYLKATLLTCKSLKKNKYKSQIITPKYLSDINSYLRQEIKKLDKDETFVPTSDFDSNFETLLQSKGVSAKDRLPELILTLKQSILHSLEVPPFEVKKELKKYILKGWEEDGKHVDWYELMCAFFQEELKKNPHLSTIIQTNLLTKLNQDISGLQLSLDAFIKPLEDFFEEYKGILSLLDEINEKVDRNFAAIQNIETKVDNIQVTEVIYTSAEYQDFKKSISRLQRLMELTDDMSEKLELSKELNETQAQLKTFKRDVIRLAETFQTTNLNRDIINLAKQKYNEGKIKEAYSLLEAEQITNGLDILLERNQKVQQDLKDKAEELLLLAQLTAVNYDLGEKRYETVKRHFEQSLKADRNIDNIYAFACFLQENKQILHATPLYEEALGIYRKLNEEASEIHLPNVAMTLNNLANLYRAKNEFKKAEEAYQEALEIYLQLAKRNPQTFLLNVAGALNNLGLLYHAKNEFKKAKEAYQEALDTYLQLAKNSPQTSLQYIANTIGNLANLHSVKNEFDKAEEAYKKALDIRRKLAKNNPQTFLPSVATTLNNLGVLHRNNDELDKAEKAYKKALDIRKKLAQINPQTYLHYVGDTLNNLAILHSDRNEFDKAEKTYKEALTIRQQFAKLLPQAYEIHLGDSYLCLSQLYRHDIIDKKKSLQNAKKAIEIYRRYSHVPHAVKWSDIAQENIDYWENENPD